MISGRPLVTNREMTASDAFVAAWLPGSEGLGVGEVLFGEHEFTGRLSFSWPAHPDDSVSGDVGSRSCLYDAGFGLSYS